MGNAVSSTPKDEGQSTDNSPSDATFSTTNVTQHKDRQPHKSSRRRESVPTVPHGRAAAAPPSASLESAHGHSASHTTSAASDSHGQGHSRQRSRTSADSSTRPRSSISQDRDTTSRHGSEKRGDEQGRVANAARKSETNNTAFPAYDRDVQPGVLPADVPTHGRDDAAAESSSTPSTYYVPNAHYGRPPRLPLPIEEEILSPGSPIISPADFSGPIGKDVTDDHDFMRNPSLQSSTTVDEDEAAEDEYQAHGRATGQMVDTIIEWREGGSRIYVTGSFSGWNKKHRLKIHSEGGPSKDPDNPELQSISIPLLVGAHHMSFVVDGLIRIAKHLPTAVDYTNVLINYIEVSPEDVPRPSAPVDIQQPHNRQQQDRSATTDHDPTTSGQDPTQSLPPPTPDLRPTHKSGIPSAGPSGIAASSADPLSSVGQQDSKKPGSGMGSQAPAAPRRVAGTKSYHMEIPAFLSDLDAAEDSRRFARANAIMGSQPTPPSLPMFLNKSILNGTLPMKDDASVLIMPNHTVLNHLATTSIKNNVLATSATTRYKRKYVTSIMHKPTSNTAA